LKKQIFTWRADADELPTVAAVDGLIYNLNVSEFFCPPFVCLASCFDAANFVSNELKLILKKSKENLSYEK